MFRFAAKKAFFDLWDHMFFALVINLVYTLATIGLAALGGFLRPLGPVGLLLFIPAPFLAASLLGGLATFWARDIVVEGSLRFGDIGRHWSASWKPSLFFGAAWLVLGVGVFLGIPFYGQMNAIFGFIFGIIMAWMVFFGAGMGLFYPGLNAQVEPHVRKLLRKAFMLFIANPWISFLMALVTVVSMVLSVVTLGFFPGVFGISIWLQVCFRFLLAKYEWIEAHPDADHKKVPWTELVAEDMDKIGPRTLRSLIFPWKD